MIRAPLHEIGELVSQFREDASGFYQYDATGLTSELTDALAVVKNLYVYEAFGTPAREVTDTTLRRTLFGMWINYYILVSCWSTPILCSILLWSEPSQVRPVDRPVHPPRSDSSRRRHRQSLPVCPQQSDQCDRSEWVGVARGE